MSTLHRLWLRWRRFSLRALFVMLTLTAIPVAWIAKNMHDVREREKMLLLLESRGATFESFDNEGELPLLWTYLGAQPQAFIVIPKGACTDAELQSAKYLFPDAVLVSSPSYERIFP